MDELTAIIFDFDGLLVDTETPAFESWRTVYRRFGLELSRAEWISIIGTHDHFDPADRLVRRAAGSVDRRAVVAARRTLHTTLVEAQPVRPGATGWVRSARRAAVRLGIASSSRTGWVRGHLERLGLADAFPVVVGRDEVGDVGKPAPDVYVEALARLEADADDALAVEDSRPGLQAARDAGLATIAVPNDLTREDVSDGLADLRLDGFTDLTLAEAVGRVR